MYTLLIAFGRFLPVTTSISKFLQRKRKARTWVLGFSRGNSDNFCANIRERCLSHHGPPGTAFISSHRRLKQYNRQPSQKPSLRAADAIELNKWAWFFPIPKANTVMSRTTTKIDYDSKNDEAGNCQDFDRCEYEFAFAIYTCEALEL